jgi:hypothetical protein
MYLYCFERILREASGDPTLTLPYWNYSDDAAKRTLPRALRDKVDASGKPNPLYESRRAPGINEGTTELPAEAVAYAQSLEIQEFYSTASGVASFGGAHQIGPSTRGTRGGSGSLETTPHNGLHGGIGGGDGIVPLTRDFPVTISYHCALHPEMTGTIHFVDDLTVEEGTRTVQIVDFAFFPETQTVRVGSAVRWANMGETEHTVTFDDLSYDTGPIRPNGFMTLPQVAARDIVFWLHHANIDRLWERWLALKDRRRHPTDQPDWMNQQFIFYGIGESEGTAIAVHEVLDTTCLGYRYDDPLTEYEREVAPEISATPVAIAALEVRQLGTTPPAAPIEISAEPVTTAVMLPLPAEEALADFAERAASPTAGARAPSLTLTLEGIQAVAAPSITFAVYVNLPPGVEPDPTSDAFVGTLYLFASFLHDEHEMGEEGLQQTFDITRAVQASQARGDAPGGVIVTIVPVGAEQVTARLATPVAEAAEPFAEAARGTWVSIERMTVAAVE